MATQEDVYISISKESYRLNKSNILIGQTDLLESLKKLYNLKILARQKHDLKKQLYKLLSSVVSDIDSVQSKMPTPKLPKKIQKVENSKNKIPKIPSEYRDIEDELQLIRDKLSKLNS